jgi:hypothetical protein
LWVAVWENAVFGEILLLRKDGYWLILPSRTADGAPQGFRLAVCGNGVFGKVSLLGISSFRLYLLSRTADGASLFAETAFLARFRCWE